MARRGRAWAVVSSAARWGRGNLAGLRYQLATPRAVASAVVLAVAMVAFIAAIHSRAPLWVVSLTVIFLLVSVLAVQIFSSGYRPVTPAEFDTLRQGLLWHETKADVAQGEDLLLDPAYCRAPGRMWRCDRLAVPVRAVYLSRAPLTEIQRYANGLRSRKVVLTVAPDQLDPARVYLRHSGEIAITQPCIAHRPLP